MSRTSKQPSITPEYVFDVSARGDLSRKLNLWVDNTGELSGYYSENNGARVDPLPTSPRLVGNRAFLNLLTSLARTGFETAEPDPALKSANDASANGNMPAQVIAAMKAQLAYAEQLGRAQAQGHLTTANPANTPAPAPAKK